MTSARREIFYDADPGYGSQPDEPGLDEYPEPHVGHYPGWLTATIWVTAIMLFWTIAYVVLIEEVLR